MGKRFLWTVLSVQRHPQRPAGASGVSHSKGLSSGFVGDLKLGIVELLVRSSVP